jgi:hypothetical protein
MDEITKMRRRICRFLAGGPADVTPAAVAGKTMLDGGERGTIAVDAAVLADLLRRGLAGPARGGGGPAGRQRASRIALTEEGEAAFRRDAGGEDAFQNQHREIDTVLLERDGERIGAAVNRAESPLAQLARRKGADGGRFLSDEEAAAGERFRADYTRGQIMPRLGANWVASVASGRRDGAGGGVELTDAALAARQRIDRAVAAVGPELSGVLIDVCCFLKGLETVETERRWPARSAKLMLKAALGALARHYAPKPARGPGTRHWGADDYRPSLE